MKKRIKKHFKRLGIILLLVILIGVGFSRFWTNKSEAAWFDDTYGYRHLVTFTHNADISADRAVTFTLDTAELISAGLMQSDCDDTRFTDPNGNPLLYDLTGTCNNAATTYEVIFPKIFNGSNLFYVYYGNPSAFNNEISSTGYTALTPNGGDPSLTNPTSSGNQEKAPSPLAYWKFDDGTGTNVEDTTINNSDATLAAATATPTWQKEDLCVIGKCLFFDGSNDYASVTDNNYLDMGTTDFSITVWVRTNGKSGYSTILGDGDMNGGGDDSYQVGMIDNRPMFELYDGVNYIDQTQTRLATTEAIDDNQWHHLAYTFDRDGNAKIYKDGVLKNTVSISQITSLDNTRDSTIGNQPTRSMFFEGFMDDLRVYENVRTEAQIKADFNSRGGNEGSGASFGTSPANAHKVLSHGLIGYWKMDETAADQCTGGTNDTCDSSGNANNGPWTGDATTTTTAKFGRAVTFDGTGDWINFGDTFNALNMKTTAAWVKFGTLTGNREIVSKSTGGIGVELLLFSNQLCYFVMGWDSDQSVCISTSNLNTTDWFHVAGTYNGNSTTMTLYLNGVSQGSTTAAADVPNPSDFYIGNWGSGSREFNGQIDEVRVYNRQLSGNEIAQLYNFAPGPVGYWDFEENTGTTANDKSGNANTGTLTSGPVWTQGKFGSGLSFDGSNDHILVTDSSSFNLASFTLSAWIKTSNAGSGRRRIIAQQPGISTPYWLMALNNNILEFGESHNSILTTKGSALNDNNWHYVAVVRDLRGLKDYWYVDGVQVGNETISTTTAYEISADVYIAKLSTDNTENFAGLIDDVKIYNYAKSSKQVVEDMNAGHPAPGSPVGSAVSYWKFDEGYSTTANDSASQNGSENLTMSAATIWTNSGKFGKALNGATNVRASVADDADLDFAAAEDFSISLWFKSDSTTNPSANEYLVEKGGIVGTAAVGYAVYTSSSSDGLICFGIDDDAVTAFPEDSVCSASDFYDNTWHHVVAKKTGTTRLDLYIDGKPNGTADTSISSTGTLENSATFFVGDDNSTDGTDEFLGDIDELKVFRSALIEADIRNEYNRGSSQILGSLSDKSGEEKNAASQEYCVPGDSSTCTSPVGRWDFEENTGTTANDTSGNANTGTLTNGPLWSPGFRESGAGVSLDGTNDYVNLTAGSTLDITSSITVSTWIKPISFPDNFTRFITKGRNSCSSPFVGVYLGTWNSSNNNKPRFALAIAGSLVETPSSITQTLATNTWHYLTGTYDGSNIRLYLNGVLISTVEASGSIDSFPSNEFAAGQEIDGCTSDPYFNGVIDQIRIYNYARSAAQVAWDYNQGGPVAHWRMDECQGTTINDSSGNGMTGTLSGSGGSFTAPGDCATSANTWWGYSNSGVILPKFNYDLSLDGTDDTVIVPNATLFNPSSSLTLSAWVYFTFSQSNRGLLAKWNGQGGDGSNSWALVISTSNVAAFSVNPSGGQVNSIGTAALNDGRWHHLAGVWDGSNTYLYVDGRLVDSDATSGTIASGTSTIHIGSYGTQGGGQDFGGSMDDVKFFNYPLTATQVKALYNDGAVRFGPASGTP